MKASISKIYREDSEIWSIIRDDGISALPNK